MIRLSLAFFVLMGWPDSARPENPPANGKKLIEWGWDEPDTKFIRQNITQMEQFPFDGLVFHVNGSKGGSLTWETWGNRKFTLDEFKQAIDDLTATKFHRFTDPFLRVNVTPGKVDCARKGVGRSVQAEIKARPLIRKLGTIDLLMVETSPVVFKNRLYRFEYVRDNYHGNKTGVSYFRFIDVATGKPTPAFAKGMHLGCSFVEGDTVYAFGVDKWGGSKITMFRSKDLDKWENRLALHLPGWGLYNTSICKADGRYVMAIEAGEPKEVVGVPFTIFFAESKDLLTWKLLPQECVYSKEKYTACPALRYLDDYFYLIYLETRPGPTYESHIVRSKDFRRWESSRLNPVLTFSDEDKGIANPKLTADQRKTISQAKNINNSDVDLCEFQGKTVIYYSWGNQQGKEFLAEAVYDGTLAEFLQNFFP